MFFGRASSSVPEQESGNLGKSGNPESSDPITGKFDPTMLERGVKALKQLDSSPNATKAFELVKLGEATRQKEILRDIERLQFERIQWQANRRRIEEEETRKTFTHKSEQEKAVAQYKAQVEAEKGLKNLEEKKKQQEEWLRKQHEQFLRQEDIRKENDKRLLEMKKRLLSEEAKAQQETLKFKIKEETLGRIKQERDNFDLKLEKLRLKAKENRETLIQTTQLRLSAISSAAKSLFEDRTKIITIISALSSLALGIYAAKAGVGICSRFIEAQLRKPSLIDETSRWTLRKGFWKNGFKSWRRAEKNSVQITLPQNLEKQLLWTSNYLRNARRAGCAYQNLLLFGEPGTGKTLFAKTLARNSGMDYALMSGGNIGPLGNEAVTKINELFKWAKHSKKGLILFIDEAEAFLRTRGQKLGQEERLSEETRNALSTFLSKTGSESNTLALVLATNCPDLLDKAVVDRMDLKIKFPLPGFDERLRMVKEFFNLHFGNSNAIIRRKIQIAPDINEDFFRHVAKLTDGLSGRQISKLVLAMQAAILGAGTNKLSRDTAEVVLRWSLENSL